MGKTVRDLLAKKLEEARVLARQIGDETLDRELMQLGVLHTSLIPDEQAEAETEQFLQKILDCGRKTNDKRNFGEICNEDNYRAGTFNGKIWQVSYEVHSQWLEIHYHGGGWTWYEGLHILLEQRDYWEEDDVITLLQFGSEYLDNQYRGTIFAYRRFGRK